MSSCLWCGKPDEILIKHHFPVCKKDGGREIILICHTCHLRVHSRMFISAMWCKDDVQYGKTVMRKMYRNVKAVFPLLAPDEIRIVLSQMQILIINPVYKWKQARTKVLDG